MILILFLYALCASTFTISETLIDYIKPCFFIGIRMFITGGLLLLYSYWKNKSAFIIAKKDRWLFAQITLFHIYFSYVIALWALQHIAASETSFLYNLYPFLAALFSYFYFSEKMTLKKWLLFIGFSGFLQEMFFHTTSTSLWISFPEFLLLSGVTSGVYGWIILRKLIKNEHYSPTIINGIGMTAGGILASLTSFFVQRWAENTVLEFGSFVKITVVIMIIANIIFCCYVLKRYTATFLSFAGFIMPLATALFGWIFLGELLSWTYFLSIFVICIGIYTFYQ